VASKRKSKTRKPREPRPNQFGVTLSEDCARLLRERAEELDLRATTLAKRLLEQALTDRVLDEGGSRASENTRGPLEKLQADLQALSRAHYNATLKLLRMAGGMSAAEVTAWAKRHLDK